MHFQTTPVWKNDTVTPELVAINFAVAVPPLGSAVYFFQYSAVKDEDSAYTYTLESRLGFVSSCGVLQMLTTVCIGASSESIMIENDVYQVELSSQTGLISSIRNKLSNQRLSVESSVCSLF